MLDEREVEALVGNRKESVVESVVNTLSSEGPSNDGNPIDYLNDIKNSNAGNDESGPINYNIPDNERLL